MAKWQINAPDGTKFEISAPDDASEEQVMQYAQKHFASMGTEKKPLAEPADVASDVAKSAGVGVAQGALGLATLPGNLEALGRAGINYGASLLGSKPVVDADTYLPNYNDWKQDIEGVTGEFYKPKTTAGEYARTLGEFLPGGLGGGSLAARGARVALPAVASETAGQITKGTSAEPYARVAGAFAGGMVPNVAARAVTPLPATANRAQQVEELNRQGVRSLTAGQRTGSKRLRFVEDATQMAPGGGGVAERMQRQAQNEFTQAALGHAGVRGTAATGDVLEQGFQGLSREYANMAPRLNLTADPTFINRMTRLVADYERMTPDGMRIPLVRSTLEDLAQRGSIGGNDFIQFQSQLKRAARGMGDNTQGRDALRAMTRLMDAQAVRSAPQAQRMAVRQELRDVNRRYRNLAIVEDAVTSGGGEAAAQGVVSPAALKNAIKRRSKTEYSRERSPMGRLAKAGEGVIRPLPSSGTAERNLANSIVSGPGAIVGSAGGYMAGSPELALLGTFGPAVLRAATARGIMSRPVQGYFANQAIPQTLPPTSPTMARLLTPYLLAREEDN